MSQVYFVQDERGRVKIGHTVDLDSRLATMRTLNADRVNVIRLIDGGRAKEQWLHRKYRHLQIRNEWFQFDESMLSVVPPDEILTPTAIKPNLRQTLREMVKLFDETGMLSGPSLRASASVLASSFWDDDVEAFIAWVRERAGVPDPHQGQSNLVRSTEQGCRAEGRLQ